MGGFFGTISKSDCIKDLFYGTDYHSHLGTKRGGIAVFNGKDFTRRIHNIENTYFRTKFEPDLHEFKGNMGIGIISDTDSQPIMMHSHLGKFALVTVGKIANLHELKEEILAKKGYFGEIGNNGMNPTEMAGVLINEGQTFTEGIQILQEKVKGSMSVLILRENEIIAARDKLGRTPMVVGRKNGAMAVAFETTCFPNLDYETDYYSGPGEILSLNPDGYEQLLKPRDKMQICSFLWVYYGYPSSYYEGINVEKSRYRCGAALAKNDNVDIDYASGIPDSGIGHAIGYANERGVPYMRPYVKYTPTWPRSFMPGNQNVRDLVAKMKLIPNRDLIDGKRLVFCDDSIVRGTQMQDNVKIFFKYGIKEFHMRVACPPLCYSCKFINFSASRSQLELASRKAIHQLNGGGDCEDVSEYAKTGSGKNMEMIESIRKRLNLSTLKYQQPNDLVDAIGLPKEKLCTHCFDGSSYF